MLPPEIEYPLLRLRAAWTRIRCRRDERPDAGLTTLEVAIIAGGLAALALGVITAITRAVNAHKAQIK